MPTLVALRSCRMRVLALRPRVGNEAIGHEATKVPILLGVVVDPGAGIGNPSSANVAAKTASSYPSAVPIHQEAPTRGLTPFFPTADNVSVTAAEIIPKQSRSVTVR